MSQKNIAKVKKNMLLNKVGRTVEHAQINNTAIFKFYSHI